MFISSAYFNGWCGSHFDVETFFACCVVQGNRWIHSMALELEYEFLPPPLFFFFYNCIKALPLGVPNAKYLASGIPSTKNQSSLGIPKLKNFATPLQYCLNYEMVRTSMPKIFWLILFTFLSPLITYLSLCLQHISLSTLSVACLLS